MRSPEYPDGAIVLTSYADLQREATAFGRGHYSEILVIGPPGTGKTKAFEAVRDKTPHLVAVIGGNAKPLATYAECYFNSHKLLVFDDAEGLWLSDNGKTLVRQITSHDPIKTVSWLSSVKYLSERGVPNSFGTASKCAFLMNRFVASREDQFCDAILSRGHIFYFNPPAAARHLFAATWLPKEAQEIHDFIGQNLDRVKGPLDLRSYNLCLQQKRAGHDWQRYFLERWCQESLLEIVRRLENDTAFGTVEDKAKEFMKLTGASRKTYFNKKNELKAEGLLKPIEPIKLTASAPEEVNLERMRREFEDGQARNGEEEEQDEEGNENDGQTEV